MMGVEGDGDDDDDSWLEQDLQEDDVAAEEFEFEMTAGAAAGAGTAAAAGSAGWYVTVIDALVEAGRADEVADLVRQKLQEGDTYRQKVAQNATSIANRFATLHGLKLLISKELGAMATQQAAAMSQLQDLQEGCTAPGGPEQGLAEQAGQCGRCRAEMGVAGLVCRHCRLDEGMRRWEVRLFSLHTRALVAGTLVSGEGFIRHKA
jgi:E3 ubiquitin-protein ligase SHPRH